MIELQTSVKQDDTTRTRTPTPGYLNLSIMNQDKPTNSISFELGSSNKDKLLHIGQIVSEARGKVIDRHSV